MATLHIKELHLSRRANYCARPHATKFSKINSLTSGFKIKLASNLPANLSQLSFPKNYIFFNEISKHILLEPIEGVCLQEFLFE